MFSKSILQQFSFTANWSQFAYAKFKIQKVVAMMAFRLTIAHLTPMLGEKDKTGK